MSAKQVTILDAALGAAGVRHAAIVLPLANHAFDYYFGGAQAQIATQALMDFLSALKPRAP